MKICWLSIVICGTFQLNLGVSALPCNISGKSSFEVGEIRERAIFNCSLDQSVNWTLQYENGTTEKSFIDVDLLNITISTDENNSVLTCSGSDGTECNVTLIVMQTSSSPSLSSTPTSSPNSTTSNSNRGISDVTLYIIIGAAAVVCVLAVILFVLSLLILLFCCLRRKRNLPTSPLIEMKTMEKGRPSVRMSMRRSKTNVVDPIDEFRKNTRTQEMESHPPIPINAFLNHLDYMRTNENQLLVTEFTTIPMSPDYPREIAELPFNMEKNRYDNILPYDHTRVKLSLVKWQEGSDYINGSHLDGYRNPQGYIATQGPLDTTSGDFWRMIWEQNSHTIVMVTHLKEKFTVKCNQYWPDALNTPVSYGGIDVTLVECVQLADFTIRTFSIVKGGSHKDIREIKQFHFTSWPDHGVPDFPTAMLAMVRAVRVHHYTQTTTGPMVVHCSAGVGRTGTFIVIDSMLSKVLNKDEYLDIYGFVTLLRHQRNFMIQTDDQYFFVHEAIAEAITCGVTEVRVEDFPQYLDKLELIQEDGESSLLETEFKRLKTDRNEPHRFLSATKNVNKAKNRFVNIMPYEFNRVKLSFIRATEGSDYINASYVDNYRKQKAFIATQGPLKNTVADFWRMVWEQKCPIFVMLTLLEERLQECSAPLWSEGGRKKFGDMYVEVMDGRDEDDYDYKEINVSHAEEPQAPPHTVRLFQFFGWPERGVPESALPLLDFVQEIQKLYITLKSDKPIVVMCSSGVGRTGVFITLDIILERIAVEGLIDLFQTVKMLRIQRPAIVQTLEQYHFCYVAILDYLLHHGLLRGKQHNRSASVERRSSIKLTKSVSPDHRSDTTKQSHSSIDSPLTSNAP